MAAMPQPGWHWLAVVTTAGRILMTTTSICFGFDRVPSALLQASFMFLTSLRSKYYCYPTQMWKLTLNKPSQTWSGSVAAWSLIDVCPLQGACSRSRSKSLFPWPATQFSGSFGVIRKKGKQTHGEKESWTFIQVSEEWRYIQLIRFAVHTKLTQHCKSTIRQCVCSWAQSCRTLFFDPWAVLAPGHRDFPVPELQVGCHFLLQGVFLTQGSNPRLCISCTGSEFFTIVPSWKPLYFNKGILKKGSLSTC